MRTTATQFVEWRNGAESWKYQGRKYSVATVWNDIRPRQNEVEWQRLVWSSLTIPRHGLIVWMALLDRLPTLNRLATWGYQVDGMCRLCQSQMETRDHLFFGCSFTKIIWESVLKLCNQRRDVGSWTEELNWAVKRTQGRTLVSLILRIAWRACIYLTWKGRNQRLYKNRRASPELIVKNIKEIVRYRLLTICTVVDNSVNRQLCVSWGLSFFD